MEGILPSETWALIATRLVRSTGRNDVLRLRVVSTALYHALQYNASLWKEMILQTHFRLFDKSDQEMIAQMSAAHWRRLLRGFSSLGFRSQTDKIDFRDPKGSRILKWIPQWGEEDLLRAGSDDEAPQAPLEPGHDEDIMRDTINDDNYAQSDIGDQLTARNKLIYGLSTNINSCSFWFSHRKAADGTPLDIKIGDLVNGDPMRELEEQAASATTRSLINNEELIQSLYSIYPEQGQSEISLTALHTAITPEYIAPNEDKYVVDPLNDWDELKQFPPRHIGCYRYLAPLNPLPLGFHSANRICHVLLPLQDPERVGFNEERVKHYQEQMKQGVMPTVLTLSRVIFKYNMYPLSPPTDWKEQCIILHIIVDGHHKIEAARRLNWPVGVLTACPDQQSIHVLQAIHKPVPSWPFSSLEFARLIPSEGPFRLLFDSFFADVGDRYPLTEQKELLIYHLCGCGQYQPDEVIKRLVCFPLDRPDDFLRHGGLIEFVSYDHMIRVLHDYYGMEHPLGRISFQPVSPSIEDPFCDIPT